MEETKKEEQKKLSYEELSHAASELHQQYQKLSAEYRKAITNLEAAYQAAQDYATGIASIQNSKFKIHNEDAALYDLSGRKITDKNLPHGIYIQSGRKVLR